MALGLISSTDERCGGDGLENFESFLAGAKGTLAVAEAACSVAGCDPTGIGCAVVCGAVEITKLAVLAADIPLLACAAHGGNVDSAEIEAGFENTKSTLTDLAAHDANIDADLAAHDVAVRSELADHDSDVKALLEELLDGQAVLRAGQLEIIRLLHTPQGLRSSDLEACDGAPCDFPDKSSFSPAAAAASGTGSDASAAAENGKKKKKKNKKKK